MVGISASRRICSVKGVWNSRPYAAWRSGTVWPVETVDDIAPTGLEQPRQVYRIARRGFRRQPSRSPRCAPISAAPPASTRAPPAHLERKPRAVLQAAAELVAALVGQRRQKLGEEVAVGEVQLDQVKARLVREPGRGRSRRDLLHVSPIHLPRHLAAGAARAAARPTKVATTRLGQRLVLAFP